jgi:hypothetical protein
MIALASDYLVFQLANGQSLPFSAEMVSAEMLDGTASRFDPEFLKHAAHAVFHYFKFEMGRQTVTVGEFAGAMEKVLRGFALSAQSKPAETTPAPPEVVESDLGQLAGESGESCELFFFPRLREEFRRQVKRSPRILRFRGLRTASKRLAGARRWGPRCQVLHDRIVEYLRHCLTAEAARSGCALVVE